MDNAFQQKLDRIKDNFLQSRFGLWNALLTINGIILALFSLTPPTNGSVARALSPYIVGGCAISVLFLVSNYVAITNTYYKIGKVLVDEGETLNSHQRESSIRETLNRRRLIWFSELLCIILVVVEVAMILYVAIQNATSVT